MSDSAASVVDLRGWLSKRRRFDDLRRLRPWGRGSVVLHDVAVGESRERPGQLRIERGWPVPVPPTERSTA